MKKYYLSALSILFFLTITPVFAADFYVDGDNGSDVIGDGSPEAPYQTITKVVSVMAGGDGVYCRGTIADGDIALTNALAGNANSYTTFTNWPGYTAIIDASIGGPRNTIFQFNSGANYFKISNLELKGASAYNIYGSMGGTSEYLELSNNKIYGITGGFFTVSVYLAGFDHLSVFNNEILGDGDDYYGIYIVSLDSAIIEKNKIHDFVRWAIVGEGALTNSEIKNNIIYNIAGDATYSYNGAIVIAGGDNINISHNSIYNANSSTADIKGVYIVFLGFPISNVSVKNNIFHTINTAIYISDNARIGFSSDSNDFYNVTAIGNWSGVDQATLALWQTATANDQHSITTDPLFAMVTAGSEDLHLQNTSPCIDAGQSISSLTNDYDNEARPYNLSDIGADERPVLSESPILLSTTTSVSTANLAWYFNNNQYSITQYNLKLDTLDDLSTAIASTSTAKEIELTTLNPAQTYYYSVQAGYTTAYADYASDYSEVASFTTYPTQVTSVKVPAAHKLKHKVTIKWLKQDRVDGYYLKLMDKNGKAINTYGINKNKAKKYLTKLSSKTTYQVKIRSRKTVGDSYLLGEWSEVKKFKTK